MSELKTAFQKIIDICKQNNDTEETMSEIGCKAKNRVIRYEWEEKYGIVLPRDCRLAEFDHCKLGNYEYISYFENGYKQDARSRSISWPEAKKQPVNEWIYEISFPTGAYIFGEDYYGQKQLFVDFFEELRAYKPDYEDLHNSVLFWKVENAKTIIGKFKEILNKYNDRNKLELRERKIAKARADLDELLRQNSGKHDLIDN